jgi:luciferase family oxidoreductase group 1
MLKRLSVLDLSPVAEGSDARAALERTIDLAVAAEHAGYHRYWLAEHHNAAGLASSAPEILIGQVARATTSLRVGSGGVMLPNHSALRVAELFKVLCALFPGRIDLGLGRAPGTDPATAQKLRRGKVVTPADIEASLDELIGLLTAGDEPRPAFPQSTIAIPTGVQAPEVWMLGSSDHGSRIAAARGLGFAFAHHMNAEDAAEEIRRYTRSFRPGLYAAPRGMVSVNVVCAPTADEARRLAKSQELAMLRFAQGLRDLPFPSVATAEAYEYTPEELSVRELYDANRIVGAPHDVLSTLESIAEGCGVEEVMVMTHIHDHEARKRSYELLSAALRGKG